MQARLLKFAHLSQKTRSRTHYKNSRQLACGDEVSDGGRKFYFSAFVTSITAELPGFTLTEDFPEVAVA